MRDSMAIFTNKVRNKTCAHPRNAVNIDVLSFRPAAVSTPSGGMFEGVSQEGVKTKISQHSSATQTHGCYSSAFFPDVPGCFPVSLSPSNLSFNHGEDCASGSPHGVR